jgi:hypothetical protein
MLLAEIFGRLDTRICLLASMLARILLLAYLMLIALILPRLASILTRFDHWMFGHLAARSDSFTSIIGRLLDNWTVRRFDAYSDLFARLHHDAQSAICLDLWSFDGG